MREPRSHAGGSAGDRRTFAAILAALLLVGCATPIRVERSDPRAVQRQLTRSVLSTGEPSGPTENVLNAWDLSGRFESDPEGALLELHRALIEGQGASAELFALSELAFVHAERTRSQAWYLASAVYAFAFLFPGGADAVPRRFDPRLRIACDLYNRSLVEAFAVRDALEVDLRAGHFALPWGTLQIVFDPEERRWGDRRLERFVPVADLAIEGLRQRYRWPGIGAPLAATAAPIDPAKPAGLLPADAKVPITALLRMDGARTDLYTGWVYATLELHTAADTSAVTIDEHVVPLEVETSSSLAYLLAGSRFWDWEYRGFFFGDLLQGEPTRLVAFEPYRPGRFPVVLVHGTASSPARWADLVNDLTNDPRIRDRFQFWFFFYDTGNPILYSADILRESLKATVATLDPEGLDPALHRMVVIGHSQGGLLTKMTAIDSGTRLYDTRFRKPIEELRVRPDTKEWLGRMLFLEPLPFVSRVVFVATPHRGSYVAGSPLASLVGRFAKFPHEVVETARELVQGDPDALPGTAVHQVQGSVHDMTPGNSLVRTLSSIPVAPGVHAHSIIAVKGDGPPERGDDGVVEYESAHIEPVDSELVVRSGHSVQGHPLAIREVRRILLEHAGDAP